MARIVTYVAPVGADGRVKVPALMAVQMGAGIGEYLEFTVEGKFGTGVRVVRGRIAEKAIEDAKESQKALAAKKAATKAAPAPAPTVSKKLARPAQDQAKSANGGTKLKRKTAVETEVPKTGKLTRKAAPAPTAQRRVIRRG